MSFISLNTIGQTVFWTETFNNGCTTGCTTYTGSNGTWTVTSTGVNDTAANNWFISCAENGNAPGSCGSACAGNATIHISVSSNSPNAPSVCPTGDCGAAYDASSGIAIVTNKRIESPIINCTGNANITLRFNYIESGDLTNDNGTVWYYDGSTWALLVDCPKTNNTGCSGAGRWTSYSIALPASADNNPNVKIGFNWTNNNDGIGTDPSFAIDSVLLSYICVSVNAGPDQTICSYNSSISLNGTSSTGSAIWTTSGTGIFSPNNVSLNATFFPSAADISAGSAQIILTSTNNGPCSAVSDTLMLMINPAPVAGANATPNSTCVGNPVSFTDASTISGGSITYWDWDFGDGNSSVFVNPSHTYTIAANYLVRLAVGSYAGCTDTTFLNVIAKSDTLSGMVTDTNNNPVTAGKVYVFTRNLVHAGLLDTMGYTTINSGNYAFPCLDTGNYILKAIADTLVYPTSVGTYYSSIPNAYQWDSASVVSVTTTGINASGKNIRIIQLPLSSGIGSISGQVTKGAGYGQRHNGGNQVLGAPLKGVDIKLGKNPGGCAARTTTDNNGNYTFSNIGLGNYKIYVDVPNYPMDSVLSVSLTSGNPTLINNNYYIDSIKVWVDTVSAVSVSQLKNVKNEINIYPNPSDAGFIIESNAAGKQLINIYDVNGKVILSRMINTTTFIDAGILSPGIYNINITNKEGSANKKLVILK